MSMDMSTLRAELAKAQQTAKEAKTPIEMANAQEVVDALYDRIDRQKLLDAPNEAPNKGVGARASPWGTTPEEDQAVIDRLVKTAGKKGMRVMNTESWRQIELHEL